MKVKNVLKVIGNLIFYFMVILISFVLIISLISRKTGEDPQILEYKFYMVLSESMEPTINKGDLVVVKKQDIKEGDIISFKGINTDTKTTHRVVKVIDTTPITYITKGDNNAVEDPYTVDKEKIQGNVIFHIPYLGSLISILKEKLLIILLLISVAIFIKVLISKNNKLKGVKINE
ncbi:signal peptidase I [Clostridium paraputrificum]|uniref:signal peptidase I n=1 Tax=Clostridium paraputrificum TaxID=29363 RepID=UPI003D3506E7